MDESSALIESILREEDENVNHDDDSGWQTVKYPKRHRKTSNKLPESFYDYQKFQPNGEKPDVFRSIEQHSEERLRRALEAQKVEPLGESKQRSDEEDDDSDADLSGNADNAETRAKKLKQKKPKKPKITVSEAASKIDASNLESFLVEASVSYESQQDIQLMRFADYFGRAFASVSASQFPWMKILKESPVMKMVDIPLSHIPEAVYKTSVDWINQRSAEALGSFVLWSLDSILADLASHQGTVKGSKKVVQQTPSKSQRLHPHLSLSPQLCVLCIANSESTDHLFIHCPFTWQLRGKLFHLINFNLAVPYSNHSLISQWRTIPLTRKPKNM